LEFLSFQLDLPLEWGNPDEMEVGFIGGVFEVVFVLLVAHAAEFALRHRFGLSTSNDTITDCS
jgi:hypothetical protein